MLNVCRRDLGKRMHDGRIGGHGMNRSTDGIQIVAGGIGRRGVRLTVCGEESESEQDAGGEAECNHDYRVCLRAGHERTLDA